MQSHSKLCLVAQKHGGFKWLRIKEPMVGQSWGPTGMHVRSLEDDQPPHAMHPPQTYLMREGERESVTEDVRWGCM